MKEQNLLYESVQNQRRKLDSTQRRIFAGCANSDFTRKEARLPEQHTGVHKDLNHSKAEKGERKAQNNIYHFPSFHRKLNLLKVSVGQLQSSAISTWHLGDTDPSTTTPKSKDSTAPSSLDHLTWKILTVRKWLVVAARDWERQEPALGDPQGIDTKRLTDLFSSRSGRGGELNPPGGSIWFFNSLIHFPSMYRQFKISFLNSSKSSTGSRDYKKFKQKQMNQNKNCTG